MQKQHSAISYSHQEDQLNSWSHALGIGIGVVVGFFFLAWTVSENNPLAVTGIALYVAGMFSSYVASTLYHSTRQNTGRREWLRKWDHAAIYWHILGSYSPVTLIALWNQGLWGRGLFIWIFMCAVVGTYFSFHKLKNHNNLETFCYVAMGMSILIAFKPLLDTVSMSTVAWIVAEGVCFVTGALFYSLHKRPYMHTVFHLFVLLGSVCHIIALWQILKQFL